MKIYRPQLLCIDGTFVDHHQVIVDDAGKITRVEKIKDTPGEIVSLPGEAMIPGLCNVHSHAFQIALRGLTQHRSDEDLDTFWTWRKSMFHLAQNATPDDVYLLSAAAFVEMLCAGITTVGEFHYLHHQPGGKPYADPSELARQVLQAAHDAGIRIRLLQVYYERAGFKKELEAGQRRFVDQDFAHYVKRFEDLPRHLKANQTMGLAPHSVRAVRFENLQAMAELQSKIKCPVHMHVQEQPRETRECKEEHDGKTPTQLIAAAGLLHESFTAVHAVHCDVQDLFLMKKSKINVCACPTTERDLGDGILDTRGLADRKIPIALGTDSQVLINLFEDARELEYHLRLKSLARNVLADQLAPFLFRAATENGAKCLDLPVGKIASGCEADFTCLDLYDPALAGASPQTLLTRMIFSMNLTAVKRVFVGGREIVKDRVHPLWEKIRGKLPEALSRVQILA